MQVLAGEEKEMKLIFLDVDGVLNHDGCDVMVNHYYGVEPEKVKLLKQIVDATGAKIVLCSTWRRGIKPGRPLSEQTDPFAVELMSKLSDAGLKLYDLTTAEDKRDHRAEEIQSKMDEYRHNGNQIDGWCVIDDELFDGYTDKDFEPHWVQTNFIDGLTDIDVSQAVGILNGEWYNE